MSSFKIMNDLFDKPKLQSIQPNSKPSFEIEDLISNNSKISAASMISK
jgi:hypothetical protein